MSSFDGKPLGSIAHIGCVSFHETKNIISGEGGALLINDRNLINRAEIIREKGTNRTQFMKERLINIHGKILALHIYLVK